MPDLALITRHLRAKASSDMLVVAVHYLQVFEILCDKPCKENELQKLLQLNNRPFIVMYSALTAMAMLEKDANSRVQLTESGRFLTKACRHNLVGYTSLQKDDPGVINLYNWLVNDGPANEEQGLSFIKDGKAESPMDDPEMARFFTLALAGRAGQLAPIVATILPQSEGHLLDIACGTGYYTYEWLKRNPNASATLFDRPEVLKVSRELLHENMLEDSDEQVLERIQFMPGDMFLDPLPSCDILLAASVHHDWPDDTCAMLTKKFAASIRDGGEFWVHDAFLNDELNGPLAVTDYSTMLFLGTRGRAYSRKEYNQWLIDAGLSPSFHSYPTGMEYHLISARKTSHN